MTAELITLADGELVQREDRIERAARGAFVVITRELRAIRDGKLYRSRWQTFEDYIAERWDWERTIVYRRFDALKVYEELENVDNCQHLPTRESHIRPLLELHDPNDRVDAWSAAVEKRGNAVRASDVAAEVALKKAAKAKDWITLTAWQDLDADGRRAFLELRDPGARFNKQDNANIEWAQWSWNPITGCKHDCPYCYARDIAARFYVQGFEPSLYASRLAAPSRTPVPASAESDVAFRNVFTCSMADLFGRWVPAEWINAVLEEVRANPQWNFLFLTKFPKRIAEFDIPTNAWMGTTVDLQARVKAAEEAFARVKCGIRWLSIEPMLEPIKFERLDLFDWVVIGGASKSTKTPAWTPPLDWLAELHTAARKAGCSIYYKENSGLEGVHRLREFPWGDPMPPAKFPDALRYLGKE